MHYLRPHLGLAHVARFSRLTQLTRHHARLPLSTLQWCSCSAPKLREELPQASSSSDASPAIEVPILTGTESLHEYYRTSPYSPGSPIFTARGSFIFNRLIAFLRAQYPRYGFQEVVTPTIYKKSLWKKSGHWENYARDMYSVQGRVAADTEEVEPEEFGLKPMNCPGHCVLFAQDRWSYRDLPVRYADFSPLHRNEVSGSLSGLTRVRRFHQDDGHIFCMPSQIKSEIEKQLDFVKLVYDTFGLPTTKFVLSTRPTDGSAMGSDEQWASAEEHLRSALDASGRNWEVNPGDGAFYGPKIDILVRDPTNEAKWLQTATIQLDFQLPIRFDLNYDAPPPSTASPVSIQAADQASQSSGATTRRPVLIHRAIYGSIERFMHLLLSTYRGTFPLWLSPRPIVLLSLNDTDTVVHHVEEIRSQIMNAEQTALASHLGPAIQFVDVDTRPISFGRKKKEARLAGYNIIGTIGNQEVDKGTVKIDFNRLVEGQKSQVMDHVRNALGSDTSIEAKGPEVRKLMLALMDRYL